MSNTPESPAPPQDSSPQDSSPQDSSPQDSSIDTPKDSFVKLAMRNMVKKRTTSLFHFGLTTLGLLGTLLALAIAFH